MKDQIEEVVTNDSIIGKIVKSQMKWAGHMVNNPVSSLSRGET